MDDDVVVEFQHVNMRFGNLQALNDLSFSAFIIVMGALYIARMPRRRIAGL